MKAITTLAQWQELTRQFAEEGHLFTGATESELLKVETKLKVTLPPSYRSFLSMTNGLENASETVPILKPVEKLEWFGREHREWSQAYTVPMQGMELPLPAERDYFDYSSEHRGSFDTKHLAQTLCISEVEDSGVLLLNPMVVWPDGEWEAWFFANWVPGAIRYRSFAEWLRNEMAERLNEPYNPVHTSGELPAVFLDGPAKANRRIRPREEVLTLDEVRNRLKSKTRSHRVKSVQHLCRIGGSEAVAILLDLFINDYDFHVRCEAAEALGRLKTPDAIEPLIEEASHYSHVTGSAISALGNFNDEKSAQCLIELIRTNNISAGSAAHALAARKDSRGVNALIELLVSKDPKHEHTGRIAGRYIAQFEDAGYAGLIPLVASEDDDIRARAFEGISDLANLSKSKELRGKACKLMEECFAREKPGRLHQWMASSIQVACKKDLAISDNPFADG